MSNMSDNSSFPYTDCFNSNIGILMIFFFILTKMIAVLFLSILILYVRYQRCQQQRFLERTSHSDIFTYNVTAIQLIFVLGTIINLCGTYTKQLLARQVGMYTIAFAYPGEILFNIVTCVERYLAVVHPITYLGLRQSGGVRIRNICIEYVWLQCFGWVGVAAAYYPHVPYIPYFCMMSAALIIVSFCNLSVLCVLNRPGPGEMGVDRKKIDQSKQKAFYTITAIMVVLLMSLVGMLLTAGLSNSYLLSNTDRCAIFFTLNWFSLPISLILPLLFLHRAGKMSCNFLNIK